MNKFDVIGEVSAVIVLTALRANPSTTFLATGILGKLTHAFLKLFFSHLASTGLIVLNVGAARLSVIIDEENYDGSIEQAEKLIKKIRDSGREMSEDEIKAIDQSVIDAFRKFASFGRVRKRRNT